MEHTTCSDCGFTISDIVAKKREPCPICGSLKRTFRKHFCDTIAFTGYFTGTVSRDGDTVAFVESQRPEFTRYASVELDGTIRLNLFGLPPQNEEDTDVVFNLLLNHLAHSGQIWHSRGRGQGDDDFLIQLTENPSVIGSVQIVRALTDQGFWRKLRKTGGIIGEHLSVPQASLVILKAIRHKSSGPAIPRVHRSTMMLVLDAYRLPALALSPVAAEVRRSFQDDLASLGFRAIYLVGPTSTLIHRLDS